MVINKDIFNTIICILLQYFTIKDLNHNPIPYCMHVDKPLEAFKCNINGLYNAIDRINKNKSLGSDAIISGVLKEVKEEITE